MVKSADFSVLFFSMHSSGQARKRIFACSPLEAHIRHIFSLEAHIRNSVPNMSLSDRRSYTDQCDRTDRSNFKYVTSKNAQDFALPGYV